MPRSDASQKDASSVLMSLKGAYAENTIRAYRSDFEAFASWCEIKGETALPSSPDAVVRFIEDKAETRAPATVERYLCGIAQVHALTNHPDPTRNSDVRLAIRRMLRSRGRRQKQAGGLRAELRARLISAYGKDLRGLRNRAIIAVGYDTLCRRSELVGLLAQDITLFEDGSGSILIRRSKTDQLGEGRYGYLSPDAVDHLQAWLKAAKISGGPLFRAVRGSAVAHAKLDPTVVPRVLKRAGKIAGLDPMVVASLSGHSMRVGAALDMVESGIDLVPVMHAGGWKSPNMVLRYTQQISLSKSGMAMLTELRRTGPIDR